MKTLPRFLPNLHPLIAEGFEKGLGLEVEGEEEPLNLGERKQAEMVKLIGRGEEGNW